MRAVVKRVLSLGAGSRPAEGATVLIYHRVGGGSPDERDLATDAFRDQLDALTSVEVVSLDTAAERVTAGSPAPSVVLTFDDGFGDVYDNAWPLLRERSLPFTVYLSSSYVGGTMRWDGSTAKAAGPALTWAQLEEMLASGLCSIGNHTFSHARPELLTEEELDRCSADVEEHLGVRPQHFAYCWGVDVPPMRPALAERFRTAATAEVGRNLPGTDPMAWRRIPVRGSDPIEFFRAKLRGGLLPERAYGALVTSAKKAGVRA